MPMLDLAQDGWESCVEDGWCKPREELARWRACHGVPRGVARGDDDWAIVPMSERAI